jgi:hypothetical protein
MLMVTQPRNDLMPCAPAIQALSHLPSSAAVQAGLWDIASQYGKVAVITPLPSSSQSPLNHQIFLVDYEDTVDAIAASRGLKCQLFGFSTLLVSIPRQTHSL